MKKSAGWSATSAAMLALLLTACPQERDYVLMPDDPVPVPAVLTNSGSIRVTPRGTGVVGLRLASRPPHVVLLDCALAEPAGPFRIIEGQRLVFTTREWGSYQFVRITAVGAEGAAATEGSLEIRVGEEVVKRIQVELIDPGGAGPDPAPQPKPHPGREGSAPKPSAQRAPEEKPEPEDPSPSREALPPGVIGFSVLDASGAGATDDPATAVLPLPRGRFQDTRGFRILDGGGRPVPAQFEILNRWWARDRSIRHVMAHFRANVDKNSSASYRFEPEGGPGPASEYPVRVQQGDEGIVVDTGVLRFRVRRRGFNLFDEVYLDVDGDGKYAPAERIVESSPAAGPVFHGRLANDIQRASEREDLEIVVEESGPIHAMIRVRSPTLFESRDRHRHGFALRIHAYAGRSQVKVEYQLQNSAINKRFSAPLYFEDLSLHLRPRLTNPKLRIATRPGNLWTGEVGGGHALLQDSDSSIRIRTGDGEEVDSAKHAPGESSMAWLDVSDDRWGVCVAIRNMSESWPNGVEVTGDVDIAARLWPKWGAQWHQGRISPTGLYWLEDMQHVLKEVLYYFHDGQVVAADLDRIARGFQRHPVCILPVSAYRSTRATLDFSGVVPIREFVSGADTRRIRYTPETLDPEDKHYALGWANFYGETGRKASSITGGTPMTSDAILTTGRADAWLTAEARAIGELNTRPQWLGGYTYEHDFQTVRPNTAPYAGISWRALITGDEGAQPLAAPYLDGTGFGGWYARDQAHGWFYHVEQFYYYSGNPWIKDWYRFIGEFRKGEFTLEDRPSWSWESTHAWAGSRAAGHNLASLMSAYRIHGDPALLDAIRNRLRNYEGRLDRRYGFLDFDEGAKLNLEWPYMAGYLCRALSQVLDETGRHDRDLHDRALQLFWALVDWNDRLARFTYKWKVADTEAPKSAGTSAIIADSQAWFAQYTGWTRYMESVNEFVDHGINGGAKPYGEFSHWTGDFAGRMTIWARGNPIEVDPPAPIRDLAAKSDGGRIELHWTTPPGVAGFHVIWSEIPIAETFTREADRRNASAARVIPNDLAGRPGERQSLAFDDVAQGKQVHFAVLCFDASGHYGGLSNVARTAAR